MDVQRHGVARKKMIRRIILGVFALIAVVGITYALSRLEPAAPSVERDRVVIDSVKRGQMLRNVRGLGTLVPEEIMFIPARDEGRVERRLVLPGTAVEPNTVLIELSNPRLEQEVFDAESQLRGAEAELSNLKVQLQSQTLDQRSAAALVEAEYQTAKAEFDANSELVKSGLLDQLTLMRSRVAADQLDTRRTIETERLQIREQAVDAQLAVQKSRIEQLRGLAELRRGQLEKLKVRAGARGVLQQLEVEVGQLVTPGTVLARVSNPEQLKAALRVPETLAKDVQFGQKVDIDTRNGIIPGTVVRIDPAVLEGTVTVDVRLEGELPRGARPDLSVDGTIELERLDDVLYIGRPVYGQPESTISLFRMEPDGIHAVRTQVRLGRTSVSTIEILEGLREGDQAILSDMSAWDDYDRIRLN